MDTNTYLKERTHYYKVLAALLIMTAITFAQPFTFLPEHNFGIQLMIGAVKAWIIVMYYMHLKGETLIGWTVIFAMSLVIFFFTIVTIDVNHFQFGDVSHITSEATSGGSHIVHHHTEE